MRFKTNRRMSTYKKVKTQKTNTNTQGAESTTKEVFEALNVTASRSEQWIEKIKNPYLLLSQ